MPVSALGRSESDRRRAARAIVAPIGGRDKILHLHASRNARQRILGTTLQTGGRRQVEPVDGRGGRGGRADEGAKYLPSKAVPRRSAPTPSRRRAPSRAEPRTGGELVGCRDFVRARPAPGAVLGHQRQSAPIRTPTGQLANGYRSHEAARVIPCRARAGSPDGRAPGRCRRMCDARCVGSRVALPRRQKGLGGPGVDKNGDRTPIESSAGFEGRASRREGHGQPPKLARTYLSHTSSGCAP